MFKLIGKGTNAILGAQTIFIWTYDVECDNTCNKDMDKHLRLKFWFQHRMTVCYMDQSYLLSRLVSP